VGANLISSSSDPMKCSRNSDEGWLEGGTSGVSISELALAVLS